MSSLEIFCLLKVVYANWDKQHSLLFFSNDFVYKDGMVGNRVFGMVVFRLMDKLRRLMYH